MECRSKSLPRAQTACSWTSSEGETSNCINTGTAPHSITLAVCVEVPEAMLVNAHAASNWNSRKHGRKASKTEAILSHGDLGDKAGVCFSVYLVRFV